MSSPPHTVNLNGHLRWHLGDGLAAEMKYSEGADSFSLDTILVPGSARSAGIGAAMIERLLHMADALDKEVLLSARPIGGGGGEEGLLRLVRYYERFEFITTDRGLTVVYMKRKRHSERCI